ncbi:MAG: SufD family Fe-S cluster assembly protein [Alistipes sp.]|nr:SufD family Fe-S cluster assembly protein [Alistipes sp.]
MNNTIKPLPSVGRIGSGRWLFEAMPSLDITIEAGAKCELVVMGDAGSADLNIDVERGAELNIVHSVAERSVADIAVALAEGAVCRITEVVTSSSDVHVVASLVERNARFELDGAFVLSGEEKGSVAVDVNHMASDCSSRTSYKGVASGKAHGSFSGLVYVAPDAQRTDSQQSSRNITIGEAHIEALPQLEIYADDVKCSHGATVGQMDDEAVLYMRQRGLSLATAKRLQIEGFVSDVVLHSAIEDCREELMKMLETKLEKL